ncbi:hypothetical protein DIPPA_32873 [Diplonema papillatum]|nr:hypothetical protein DIPPA_32873 [Diplonema papillatum]
MLKAATATAAAAAIPAATAAATAAACAATTSAAAAATVSATVVSAAPAAAAAATAAAAMTTATPVATAAVAASTTPVMPPSAARVGVRAGPASRQPMRPAALNAQAVVRAVVHLAALVNYKAVVSSHASAHRALLLCAGIADRLRAEQRVRLRSRYKHGKARALRQRGGHVPAQRTLCPPRRVVLREHVPAPVLPVPGSCPRKARLQHPVRLLAPGEAWARCNGDGSCRSRHRRHNVDSIVQRVFPLWLAASLRIPGGAGTSTPVWTSKSTASSTHDTSPAFVHLSADSQPLSARIARPPYGHLGGSSGRRSKLNRCCTAGSGAAACQGCIGCTAERRRRSASTRAVYTAAMRR